MSSSLLASLEKFQEHNQLTPLPLHPFAYDAPETCSQLQNLINLTSEISHSLAIYQSISVFSNPKLISHLRQHSSIEHTLFTSERNTRHLITALKERKGVSYGENVPLVSSDLPTWCIDQFVAWGNSVGMEAFKDENTETRGVTVVLGGKVLVIDAEFVIEQNDPLNPRVRVSNVKTSNALLAGTSNESASPFLDSFLMDGLRTYCEEMQKHNDVRSPQLAATIRKGIVDQLRYLVILDHLASRKDDGGIRWFTDLDELYPMLKSVSTNEAEAAARDLSLPNVPLDILLTRGHALALPYLTIPSLSFLTYVSPAAYLHMRKTVPPPSQKQADATFLIDTPLEHIRREARNFSRGVTIAALALAKVSEVHLWASNMSMNSVPTRPSFPLLPVEGANLDHSFPQLENHFGMTTPAAATQEPYTWVLDFTDGGKRPGVVVSQTRMKEIELVVNSLGSLDGLGSEMLSFGTASWLDLLLNPEAITTPEWYTALYVSPNSLHPPLKLRLAVPQEPGFVLERVPVHSAKEVWGVLEVVREQCWLNEILLSCKWSMEGPKPDTVDSESDGTQATEEDLRAVLAGTFKTQKLPVNIFLPIANPSDNLFGADAMELSTASKPKIVMSMPERPPFPGLAEIVVLHDEGNPRGVSVSLSGAMGSELKSTDLEEICRRGGTLGLPGRVWASCPGPV